MNEKMAIQGRKLKILQFMASEKYGGAEKVCIDLSNELSNTHSVTALVLRKTEYLDRFLPDVEIVKLQSNPTRNNPFLLSEIFQKIKAIQPDIVHTHGGKAAILMRRLRYFVSLNHLATKHNGRKGRVFNTLPYVSVVSQQAMDSIKSKRRQQIRRIYNGIEPRPQQKILDHDVFKIAAVGRLDKIKGFDILINQLASVSFPYQLIIAGEGDEKSYLERRIAKLHLQDRVKLIGFCNDIPKLMASSHLIVAASHSEGFPQVMVEALFYGNVFISTQVGGAVEVLPLLFLTEQKDLGMKIRDVYQNYSHYSSQFESLKKKEAGRFLLSKIRAEYEAFYYKIVNEQKS
jgi:glycosyltransferase involved in cell wall biosynthesis